MYIALIAACVYGVVCVLLALLCCYMFSFRRGFDIDKTFQIIVDGREAAADFLDKNTFDDFSVCSRYGYNLTGVCRKGTVNHTIIFAHGHTFTWHGGIKYMHTFIEHGWNIVAFNHRHHGTSGGKNCTAGFYEKHDLKLIADFALEKFPGTQQLGVHGESLGGAIALQYAPLDNRLSFVIADSPFSNAYDLFASMMRYYHIPSVLAFPARICSNIFMKMLAGFSLKDASPQDEILKTDVLLLFFHGLDDDYVPYAMTEKMYALRKELAHTELVLVKGAQHSRSYMTDPVLYNRKVWEFIDSAEGHT